MTTEIAFRQLSDAIGTSSVYPLSDAGREYLRGWCSGTGRDHEPRPDIFASEEGPELLADLCEAIGDVAGKFLDASVEARTRVNPESLQEIGPADLYALNVVLSTSGTRLCNDDPKPSA